MRERSRVVRPFVVVVASLLAVAGLTRAFAQEDTTPSRQRLAAARESAKDRSTRAQDGAVMRQIPAGTFEMGSAGPQSRSDERPVHTVRLTKSYLMDEHEVTVGQYRKVVGTVPAGQLGGDDHPVVNVSWEDAGSYCARVSARLPTEAQWEYAARGGLPGREWPWGDEQPCAGGTCRANLAGSKDGYAKTSPVCSFAKNGYGLCDIAGNVWEWTLDWRGPYSSAAQADPTGPSSNNARVLRGGSWYSPPRNARAASRNADVPSSRFFAIGFRCVRDSS